MWVGVELDVAGLGRTNGVVDGKAYFLCKPSKGLFVRPSALSKPVGNRRGGGRRRKGGIMLYSMH